MENETDAIKQEDNLYGSGINAQPMPKPDIGADTDNHFLNAVADAGINSTLDLTSIDKFTQVGQRRDQMYTQIDSLCQDSTMAAVLEAYAEDTTEYNQDGRIVWATSNTGDPEASKYINYLLKTLQVDKNIYKWVHCLCKYGDVYVQLFKQSEYEDELEFTNGDVKKKKLNENKQLDEDVKVKAFSVNDKYVNYVEMVPNPAEMFELTKFGKTHGYIKADVSSSNFQINAITNLMQTYQFNKRDVTIYAADKFVHASLDDNSTRYVEEVNLILDSGKENEDDTTYNYIVKSGQSLFYNVFKIWRELSLLENAMLLNRVTKSSIVRAIKVNVGDMGKEEVQSYLYKLKALFEQKEAINVNNKMSEYNNPGPIENNIYIPVKGENNQGDVTVESVGGDVNISQLPDIEYFQDKLWGGLRVPKQFFGVLRDNAGFSGGDSLASESSRYAKMIKRIQATITQMITTLINLFLLDRKMSSYINAFTIHMLTPATKEENDRQDNLANRIQLTRDVMDLMADLEDPSAKLKILKIMLNNVLSDDEIASILEEEINKLEEEGITAETGAKSGEGIRDNTSLGLDSALGLDDEESDNTVENEVASSEEEATEEEEETLPSPAELGLDFTDNTNTEFEEEQ